MIYALVLVKLVLSLAPDRAVKKLRFSGDFLPCPLIQSSKYTMPFRPQPLFGGDVNSECRKFHFISNYLVLQNTDLCHRRSRKTEKQQ